MREAWRNERLEGLEGVACGGMLSRRRSDVSVYVRADFVTCKLYDYPGVCIDWQM